MTTQKGEKLTRKHKQAIRAEVVDVAKQTGARAYKFAWDGDKQVQVTGFPNGQATVEEVTVAGVSVAPRQLLSSLGVPTRWLGVASAAVVVLAEVVRVVLS